MEGKDFKDKWKDAVAGAEVEPSEAVWSSIQSYLLAVENQKMKRQVILYQRIAAVSISVALMLSAFGFYLGGSRTQSPAVSNLRNQTKPAVATIDVTRKNRGVPNQQPLGINIAKPLTCKISLLTQLRSDQASIGHSITLLNPTYSRRSDETETVSSGWQPRHLGERHLANVESASTISLALLVDSLTRSNRVMESPSKPTQESTVVIPKKDEENTDLASLPLNEESFIVKEKRPNRGGEGFWAAIGLSAGNYDPGSASNRYAYGTNNYPAASYTNVASSQSTSVNRPAVGNSYTVGLTIGKRLARRWVIQGGVNYLSQSSRYTSEISSTSSYSNNAQAFDQYHAIANPASSVTITTPYQINSTLEFISVPVQAGYLIVDRRMGFQLNAGVAGDFFVRNSLQDRSGQLNTYTQSGGSDSPYRSVNWAGLISTELSYRLGRQYRVSFVPGVRYLFNSALKSGAITNSYMADVGFRFRYILK